MTRKPRILLVDDSVQNRALIRPLLEADGYEVVEADDGPLCLELCRSQPTFDLIILDLMLPSMDGYEVLSNLKAGSRTADVPVLVMSVIGEDAARLQAFEMGASEFLMHPASRAELRVRVRGLVRSRMLQERLDDSFLKLTSLVRTTEVQLDELAATGRILTDPLPALLQQVNLASKAGRSPELVAALDGSGEGFQVRLFRGDRFEYRPLLQARGGPRIGECFVPGPVRVGVWNTEGLPRSTQAEAFATQLADGVDEVRNMAWCSGPSIALVAVNYPGGADALDAEVVRGFVLHWQLVRRLVADVRDIEEAFEYTVAALARAAEAYDDMVGTHIRKVAEYCEVLADGIGHAPEFVRAISVQSRLHDVGKIHIPIEILRKPASLTPDETEMLKSHTTEGARILGKHPRLRMAADIALTHHERFDGTGYPQGLKGEEIPIEGRIVRLADIYDALRSHRSYKGAQDHVTAFRTITEGDGRVMPCQFDPEILDVFRRIGHRFEDVYESMLDIV